MTGRLPAGLRSACCAASAAALLTGCGGGGGGEKAQPEARPSAPGSASSIPTAGARPSSASPTTRPSDGPPSPRRVDQHDATAVSKAALTVMYSVDSAVDTGLRDARLRAAPYLTPGYAAGLRAEPVQYVPNQWRRHRAYLTVRIRPLEREAGAPSDGPTAAYRQWELTTTPTGRDGWRGDPHDYVVYTVLTRSSERGPWRISDVLVNSGTT